MEVGNSLEIIHEIVAPRAGQGVPGPCVLSLSTVIVSGLPPLSILKVFGPGCNTLYKIPRHCKRSAIHQFC